MRRLPGRPDQPISWKAFSTTFDTSSLKVSSSLARPVRPAKTSSGSVVTPVSISVSCVRPQPGEVPRLQGRHTHVRDRQRPGYIGEVVVRDVGAGCNPRQLLQDHILHFLRAPADVRVDILRQHRAVRNHGMEKAKAASKSTANRVETRLLAIERGSGLDIILLSPAGNFPDDATQPPDSSWCRPEANGDPSCSTSQTYLFSTSPVAGFTSSWVTQTAVGLWHVLEADRQRPALIYGRGRVPVRPELVMLLPVSQGSRCFRWVGCWWGRGRSGVVSTLPMWTPAHPGSVRPRFPASPGSLMFRLASAFLQSWFHFHSDCRSNCLPPCSVWSPDAGVGFEGQRNGGSAKLPSHPRGLLCCPALSAIDRPPLALTPCAPTGLPTGRCSTWPRCLRSR